MLLTLADAVMNESSDAEFLQFWYSPLVQKSRLERRYEE